MFVVELRVTRYQLLTTDAFGPSQDRQSFPHTINDAYVDGLSLTHGREHAHIWTFAARHSEANNISFACYCGDNSTHRIQPPAYVGEISFVNLQSTRLLYHNTIPFMHKIHCGMAKTVCKRIAARLTALHGLACNYQPQLWMTLKHGYAWTRAQQLKISLLHYLRFMCNK